jgi:hypothetical protein
LSSAAFKINDLISDEEIEECIDGSSDIKMIREIISVTQLDNLVDIEDFADMFSYKIRNFIDVEIEDDEEAYDEAYMNNWEWGSSIAENINTLLINKWTNV